jgi:hypothetical protein
MNSWKKMLAAAVAGAALATASLVTVTAVAADRSEAAQPQRLAECSMHTAQMDGMHEAMGGDAMHDQMPGPDMMSGAGMMNGAGMTNGPAPQ